MQTFLGFRDSGICCRVTFAGCALMSFLNEYSAILDEKDKERRQLQSKYGIRSLRFPKACIIGSELEDKQTEKEIENC